MAGCTRAASPILISCVGVDLELILLPFFLDHYLAVGIEPQDIKLIANTEDAASENLAAADEICRARNVAPPRRWIAPYTSGQMWAQRRATQAEVAGPQDWVVNADVDEFHRYPAPLGAVAAYLEEHGRASVQGVMVDRLAPEGGLVAVRPDRPLDEQFPHRADVSLSVFGTGVNHGVAGTLKLMMHRGDVMPKRGGHTVAESGGSARYATGARLSVFPGVRDADWRSRFPFQVDHYKWTATLSRSLKRRLATPGVSVAGREYGDKIDRYLAAHGRVRFEDASVFERSLASEDWQGQIDRMRRVAPYFLLQNAVRWKVRRAVGAWRR